MKKYLFVLTNLLLFTVISSYAQPKAMHYQGVARDEAGTPVADKEITIRASIVSDSIGSVINYSETQAVKTSASGLFSLAIGKGKVVSGVFASINWAVDKKFLKIELAVDNNAFVLTGISQLLSVPYAIYAEKAGNAINFTAKAPLAISQTNVIGLNAATTPGDLLTWDGTNWVAKQPEIQKFTLSNMQPYLVLNYCIAMAGIYPSRNGSDTFLGEIMLFAGNFAPKGYALCNGQLLPINQNQALFSLLGTTYGGDGKTTFALPDLRGRVPMSAGSGPGLTPRSLGENYGSETISR
jgi:microcystin-dependent protein